MRRPLVGLITTNIAYMLGNRVSIPVKARLKVQLPFDVRTCISTRFDVGVLYCTMPPDTVAKAAALVTASSRDGNDVKVVDCIVKVTALRVGALGVAQPAVPGATRATGQ